MANRSRISLYVGVPVVVIVWLAFVVVLVRSGFLTISTETPEGPVVAAVVALVGAFLGTLVSLLGLILKHTLDEEVESRRAQESARDAAIKRREDARLELEGERNAQLQTDAERRLALEAGIKAVQLFATSTGSPALPVQYSGALFTLASFNQHELTLSLASLLLRGKSVAIDPETAASLINRALRTNSPQYTHSAISVLLTNVPRLFTTDDESFPECVLNWNLSDDYVRYWALVALAEAMMVRPVVDWNRRRSNAYSILAALGLAWFAEGDKLSRADLGAVLRWVLLAFPNATSLAHPSRTLDMRAIARDVETAEPESEDISAVVERLKAWSSGGKAAPQPTTVGAS